METIYCANCDADAVNRTAGGTPLCFTCSTAFEWGFQNGNGNLIPIEDSEEED